jgi:1-deoxy-D-xylulose-5-phosphate reductoisomerase
MADLPFPRRIALLGSTGSIGRQTLDVVRAHPEQFQVVALAARNNVALLAEQVREFAPALVASDADDPAALAQLGELLPQAARGLDGLMAIATIPEADILVTATSGLIALRPTLAAIAAGKTIAIANKETLVMAGHMVMRAARERGVAILPIDSEHSALWQCLRGEQLSAIRKLIITASGGPFRRMPQAEMATVTAAQALKHPTWVMGPKITIDSATLMNKGLEVIEARWLYDLPIDDIEVVVQPQSIIHSMVEFVDGSIKMQASLPTMHLPIQEALSHPTRLDNGGNDLLAPLHWDVVKQLDFEALDINRFPCFRLALEAGRRGGTATAALVGADETAVALFLRGEMSLPEIAACIERVLTEHTVIDDPDLDTVLATYAWACERCAQLTAA